MESPSWSATVFGSVIGSSLPLLGLLITSYLRDVRLPFWQLKKRQEGATRHEFIRESDALRVYLQPLLESCEALNSRLCKVLNQKGSADFLKENGSPKSELAIYMKASTVYKLANLLGCIRAYEKARPLFKLNDAAIREIRLGIKDVQNALENGAPARRLLLEELLRLWVPGNNANETTKAEIAESVDNLRSSMLCREDKKNAKDLSAEGRKELCKEAAKIISSKLAAHIPDGVILDQLGAAIDFFSMTQVWIYEDWQQAIGDAVLIPLGGARSEVMGYLRFESLLLDELDNKDEANKEKQKWFKRLEAVFTDLDPNKTDMFDARREQVRSVHRASRALQNVLETEMEKLLAV
jgi:hypothetical protein